MITEMIDVTSLESSHVTAVGQTFLVPSRGLGKELSDMLREKLGVPDNVKNFSVRFAVDEVVTVRCEFMPKG